MEHPKNASTRLAAALGALLLATTAPGCANDLQTVVETRANTVLVRYEDGRLAEVLNDMRYDLAEGQQVKVVENCDGQLHIAVAYAPR